MILACHNLNKSFGDHLIVRDGSFHVEDREKAALVGVNGAGKSTIFKMIVGELPLDEGDVILTKGKDAWLSCPASESGYYKHDL